MKKFLFAAGAALVLLSSCQTYQVTSSAPPMARDRDDDARCKAAGSRPGTPFYDECRGAI